MVYKKYIRKNGKLYGPYTYHSKRVDGKVVSEYHGRSRTFNINVHDSVWIILGVFSMLFLIYLTFNLINVTIVGKTILDLETTYYEGQALVGTLKLGLKQGELIPAESKLIVETSSGKEYEYNFEDIAGEEAVEGNIYVEAKSFSGTGKGYGAKGEKPHYPPVYFTQSRLGIGSAA